MSADGSDTGVEIPDKMFFRIGEAAEIVGVEPHVLRYWEGEFKLRPQRSSSGQRMYRRKDLGKLIQIRRLLHDEGFTIAGARKALSAKAGSDATSSATASPDLGRVKDALTRIDAVRKRMWQLEHQPSGSEDEEPPVSNRGVDQLVHKGGKSFQLGTKAKAKVQARLREHHLAPRDDRPLEPDEPPPPPEHAESRVPGRKVGQG